MAKSRISAKDTAQPSPLSTVELTKLQELASNAGYTSIKDFLAHLQQEQQTKKANKAKDTNIWERPVNTPPIKEFYRTELGTMYHGNALDFMFHVAPENSVDLIMTSPPFGLVRKKSYGNEDAAEYCDWFRPFATGFHRILKETGSLVIDIGGAWKKGYPTRSLYHYELLIMLCKEYGFHLCLEHFWWNPSKLPTPAEWTNIRRIRPKDAVNCIWWLAKTPWPKASNRRILAPYSKSMKSLIKNGYKAKRRPSGHNISKKFGQDNGGSVPPNLLAIANTESNSYYQAYCRNNNLPIHPARFPELLPEYFIRFLTDKGNMVFDPFGGSCVTGAVAESLERRWVCTELNEPFLKGAKSRFSSSMTPPSLSSSSTNYTINTPCSIPVDESKVVLQQDGGKTRPKKKKPVEDQNIKQKEEKKRATNQELEFLQLQQNKG